jgi:hypothetical protein
VNVATMVPSQSLTEVGNQTERPQPRLPASEVTVRRRDGRVTQVRLSSFPPRGRDACLSGPREAWPPDPNEGSVLP